MQNEKEIVLVVDDEHLIRQLIKDCLCEYAGWTGKVVLAEDGKQAIEILQSDRLSPVLILSDVRMPRLDGVQMAGQIREMGIKTDILFMSGNLGGYTSNDLAKYSPHKLLTKPFSDLLVTMGSIKKVLEEIASRKMATTEHVHAA